MSQQRTDMLDGLQVAVITEAQKKKEQNKPKYSFDKLALYFRQPYEVKGIKIAQPSIGDILEITEDKFYSGLSPILYNSTSIRVSLWDAHIDWCEVKDLEVFYSMSNRVDTSAFRLLFPDRKFEKFKIVAAQRNENSAQELALYDGETLLWEEDYMEIAEYIRTMLNVHPKIEKAKGKTAKKWMIEEDRMNAAMKKEEDASNLLPIISACVNHPGFKYKLQELREVGIYEFMDSVQRLQIYESTHALMSGIYSGFCDTKKINKEAFNFMREIHK